MVRSDNFDDIDDDNGGDGDNYYKRCFGKSRVGCVWVDTLGYPGDKVC